MGSRISRECCPGMSPRCQSILSISHPHLSSIFITHNLQGFFLISRTRFKINNLLSNRFPYDLYAALQLSFLIFSFSIWTWRIIPISFDPPCTYARTSSAFSMDAVIERAKQPSINNADMDTSALGLHNGRKPKGTASMQQKFFASRQALNAPAFSRIGIKYLKIQPNLARARPVPSIDR